MKTNLHLGPPRTGGSLFPKEPVPTTGIVCDASCFDFQGSLKNDGYFHGRVEYRVMDLATKEFVYTSRVFPQGTINQAEFLGLYEALRWMHENEYDGILYGDNKLANGWARNGCASSRLPLNEFTWEVMDEVTKAEDWIRKWKPRTRILWWNKYIWGENPADYQRK